MQAVDYFASIVWLIMRGDAVAKEFLAALTDSQVSEFHGQHTNLEVVQWTHGQCSYCTFQIPHHCLLNALIRPKNRQCRLTDSLIE